MDFELDDDQASLAELAGKILGDLCTPDRSYRDAHRGPEAAKHGTKVPEVGGDTAACQGEDPSRLRQS